MGACFSRRRWRKAAFPPRDGIADAISGMKKHKDSESLKKDKKLRKLIEYSGAHPEEISGIGAYLIQHLNRDLDKKNYTRVEVAVNIMDLLLESCRRAPSWTVLVDNCLQMVKHLVCADGDEPHYRLETMGINLFLRHADLHREAESMCQMYNQLTPKFMCIMAPANADTRRLGGFNAIKAVSFNALQLIPKSSNSQWGAEMLTKIILSFLSELLEEPEDNGDVEANEEILSIVDSQIDFGSLYVDFVRDLIEKSRVKNGQLNFVVGAILKYFTMTDNWNSPNEFATTFFLSIFAGCSEVKLEIFLQCLIKHIECAQKSISTNELVGMANVLTNFAPLATQHCNGSEGQKMMNSMQKQIFMGTLELVQYSMELKKTRKDRALISEYQDKLLEAMNKIASGLPDSAKLQAFISAGSPMPIIIAEKPFFNAPPIEM
ncbi:plasma membrane localization protein [Globodera pallida]|nr:plasma membrane localization protein [Globodera pallida]